MTAPGPDNLWVSCFRSDLLCVGLLKLEADATARLQVPACLRPWSPVELMPAFYMHRDWQPEAPGSSESTAILTLRVPRQPQLGAAELLPQLSVPVSECRERRVMSD